MDVFLFALNAILPIILLIILGYALKRIGFLNESFTKLGNKFVYRVCLPVLLFKNVYDISSFGSLDWSIVLYSEIAIIVIFLIGLVSCIILVKDPKQRGVILQCAFRSNYAIIGLTLAASLGGEAAKGVAAILSAFSIPTFNILAVISLAIFIKDEESNKGDHMKKALINICKNPLIIGVVAGLIVLAIRSAIPTDNTGELVFSIKNDLPFLYTSISNVASIASPLALVILGAGFSFSAVGGMLKEIILGTTIRIIIAPLLSIGVAVILSKYTNILNFDSSVYPALIALFGSPVAVSSAIMAEEMKNDGTLAGQLVIWTSLFSVFTIFIAVVILRSMQLL